MQVLGAPESDSLGVEPRKLFLKSYRIILNVYRNSRTTVLDHKAFPPTSILNIANQGLALALLTLFPASLSP